MSDQLQVGLMGCGKMARNLARALNGLDRARIARVCDIAEDAAKTVGEELDVPWSTEADAIFNDPDIGAVIVATPNFTHETYTVQAASAHKHVFCEKPMALDVAACDRMIAAAEQHGVHLVIGQVLRYLPTFDQIKRLIDGGAIGRPFSIRTSRLSSWGSPAPWRNQRAKSGGPLFEVNVHEFDYMSYLLGEPVRVYATGSRQVVKATDFDDTYFVHVSFAQGGHSVLHSSIGAALGGYSGIIQGEEGTITFTNWPNRVCWKRFDGKEGELSKDELNVNGSSPHARELGHLVEAALDGVPPAISGKDGRTAVAIAEAAVTSIQSQQTVDIGNLR